MKYFYLCFFILIFSSDSFCNPLITKSEQDQQGATFIIPSENTVVPIELPESISGSHYIIPFRISNKNNNHVLKNTEVLSSDTIRKILFPGEWTSFVVNMADKTIFSTKTINLTEESIQAIMQSPSWISDQLTIKLSELRKNSVTTERQYAELIISAPAKLIDEVAFTIANMSYQSLTDPRFISDKEAIVRNAEMIYRYADSLKYVKLEEVRDIKTGDYYTTTSYRIYDPEAKDTIWTIIPKEIYYWYIVHPKMDQEGAYVKDNGVDGTGQRTYGFAWRDYIWNNQDPMHDYTKVNKTTSKGSVLTIPRFGEIIQSAEILWNRNKTYYQFGRAYNSTTMALDIIGNWCSQALPVDVTLPRAFQPNQILMKHDGMCNEDAFLVASACRTALIPIIYLGTWSEDHVFGAVWDKDWNHFEFFRGGLQPNGNQFYGITNLLDRGSYGWKNAMVEGFRPDGFAENFTKYYANTAKLQIRINDSKGNPVEGASLTFYSSPNGSSSGYLKCGTGYSDAYGNLEVEIGEQKKYLVQVWHPKLGWAPSDSTKAYVVLNSNAVAGSTYSATLAYETASLIPLPVNKVDLPENSNYGVNVRVRTRDILSGQNLRDSQRSRFYKWNKEEKGLISLLLTDSLNYAKFTRHESFDAMEYLPAIESGDISFPVESKKNIYAIISNHNSVVHLQKIDISCSLLQGDFTGIIQYAEKGIKLYPNPFTEELNLNIPNPDAIVKIFDLQGNLVKQLQYPFVWYPQFNPPGIYTIVTEEDGKTESAKVMYIK